MHLFLYYIPINMNYLNIQAKVMFVFKHVHTIMPNFISTDFMEIKIMEPMQILISINFKITIIVNPISIVLFTIPKEVLFSMLKMVLLLPKLKHILMVCMDMLISFGSKYTCFIRTFWQFSDNADFVPEGQSLWYQVFNPNGRGVGLFAQINWSCGTGVGCGDHTPNKKRKPLIILNKVYFLYLFLMLEINQNFL